MDGLLKLIIVTLVLAITAGLTILILNPREVTPIIITPGIENPENKLGIYGAVKTPGIYVYHGNIRIEDAVEMAGGFAENADPERANPAKWVNDGETIIIPTMGSIQPTLTIPVPGTGKVNLNTADKAELMTLPGIGEKRAGDIIELRERKGKFENPEDILQINGISEKILENIYDMIIVE